MSTMLPDHIDQTDPRRNGERMVFGWFSQPNVPGTTFYSIEQKTHKKKLISEVDFLYVCDRGFLCVEVKGGQAIFREDRTWYSTNYWGEDNEINNPFQQAIGCQNALKRYFEQTYGKYSNQANCLIGYAVIFPECIFTGSGNDLVTEVVFDGKWNVEDFPRYLNKVFDYWEEQEKIKHSTVPVKLSTQQTRQAIDLLRGDFHVIPSMKLELQSAEQKMIELTEDQYDLMFDLEDNKHAVIFGAAGTGKSVLALEYARRCAAKGKSVLYLCYNRNMMLFAKNSLSESVSSIDVSTYHGLLSKNIKDNSFITSTVPDVSKSFLQAGVTPEQKYDVVVIDEGQDLMYTEVLDTLNLFIEKGLKHGRWAIFLDPNQNIFNPSEEYDFAWEYLQAEMTPYTKTLRYNCRNTEQIARRTAELSWVPPAKYLKIQGTRVITKTFDGKQDFIKIFKQELTSLLASGVLAKDIVILSRNKKQNSLMADIDSLCGLQLRECNTIVESRSTGLNFFTVQSFKGLESKIVFFVDIPGFESVYNRMLNYVGMSRAMLQLYIFFDKSVRDEYEEVLEKGEDFLI